MITWTDQNSFEQVMIMKQLDHPNIVKLVEVIDDPESDNFYMGVSSFSSILYSFPSKRICSISQ